MHNASPSHRVAATISAACLVLLVTGANADHAIAGQAQRSFVSTAEAVAALMSAVQADGTRALVQALGPQATDIVQSGDAVADAARRRNFATAFNETHRVEAEGGTKAILVIGKDDYPFPIPLVRSNGKWRWDTAAGIDEILARRIGENELAAIQVMRTYVDAQREFATADRDGHGPQYARTLLSSDGKRDGLYWPASDGSDVSPLGPLVAQAQTQGYRPGESGGPSPYHGYLYRILMAQGSNAVGGAQDYVVNGRMIGGFALIAMPAQYGNSGIMTFVVNQEGDVFQKDLGPETKRAAASVARFDPDKTWEKINP